VQTFKERQPAPALAGHLETVWVQRVSADGGPYEHRTIPHGSIEIAVELGSLPRVIGPQTGPIIETLAPGRTVVGVRFRHGVAPLALGLPASELVDLSVEWEDEALGEAIAGAGSPEQAAAILERAVLDRLVDAPQPDPVIGEAVRQLLPWGRNEVGSLPHALHISERQLRRRAAATIGLAPKVLHRMLRFQGFLALAHTVPHADLAALAAETGYADQPHLNRESLRLAGATPRVLLEEAAVNCVGIHDHAVSRGPLLARRRDGRSVQDSAR
jgi:AraC-like DNA-binding protein